MEKFLLVVFFIIKIIVIIAAPIAIFIFRNRKIKNSLIWLEIIALLTLFILYIVGFSYVVDSNIISMYNIKILSKSKAPAYSEYMEQIELSQSTKNIDADTSYKTHKNEKVYYYNGFEMPLSAKKVECDGTYDYFKNYSSMITSTAMLLSSYFNKEIDPIEVYNKAYKAGLIKCDEPINKDQFFLMIYNDYKVNFNVISFDQLENYILNGKPVLLETIGNGNLSCTQSYYLIYDINNSGEYLMLDPNNKSYSYICPDGTTGFGNILKSNYNDITFSSSEILSDSNRFIVIGGTRK